MNFLSLELLALLTSTNTELRFEPVGGGRPAGAIDIMLITDGEDEASWVVSPLGSRDNCEGTDRDPIHPDVMAHVILSYLEEL